MPPTPVEPDALLHLIDAAAGLKRVPRTGWLLRSVSGVESVAEHSYATAVTVLVLCDAINAAGGQNPPLDSGRAAIIALLHDLAETRLTDLPEPAVRYLGRDAKRAAEEQILRDLLRLLPSGEHLMALWLEYAEDETPEAHLVHDADRLEMMVQCLTYEKAGHRGLDEFWSGSDAVTWHYELCRDLYERLREARP